MLSRKSSETFRSKIIILSSKITRRMLLLPFCFFSANNFQRMQKSFRFSWICKPLPRNGCSPMANSGANQIPVICPFTSSILWEMHWESAWSEFTLDKSPKTISSRFSRTTHILNLSWSCFSTTTLLRWSQRLTMKLNTSDTRSWSIHSRKKWFQSYCKNFTLTSFQSQTKWKSINWAQCFRV